MISNLRALASQLIFSYSVIHRSTFSSLVLVVTVISTLSSFVRPTANAYVLNCFGLHLAYIVVCEMKWYENSEVSVICNCYWCTFDSL